MTPDLFTRPPEGCDTFQGQLSELADSGEAPTPALLAHLDRCDGCTRFAERWLQGPPPELARPAFAVLGEPLRERILDAAVPRGVVRFPAPANARPPWTSWLGRIAATLVVGGFAYWLLNPSIPPAGNGPTAAISPTLTQGLAQLEGRSQHEQEVLRTALADGGREVRGNVAWSLSALEL